MELKVDGREVRTQEKIVEEKCGFPMVNIGNLRKWAAKLGSGYN
jgi:hypothetical protein